MTGGHDDVELVPVEWPVAWGPGQPEAVVVSAGPDVFLIHPARQAGAWALLRFEHCEGVRHGGPNIEVSGAHPLGRAGAEPGELYVVQGSAWRHELEAINITHPQHSGAYWQDVKHYFCFLWESTFECLARSLGGETLTTDLRGAIDQATRRMHVAR